MLAHSHRRNTRTAPADDGCAAAAVTFPELDGIRLAILGLHTCTERPFSSAWTAGDAVAGAGVVVLAVPGGAVAEVVAALGAALAGRVVIDAANRISQPEVNSRAAVVAAAPGAGYVRAFNTLGWENFADPPPGAVLFFAADPGARPVAEELITATGLEPVFAGDADACGTVDALLPLWFALVPHNGGNRRVALRITP